MKIDCVKVGYLQTNCYILNIDNEVIIIDPGDEKDKIKECILNKKVSGIIITHYHFDHIGAMDELVKETNAKIYDYNNLKDGKNKIGPFSFECIYTPGHKEDLISLYFRDVNSLFCGDFIFEGTIGRTDLHGGNFKDMQKSIEKILKYADNLIIYPGHGNKTTLGKERDNLKRYLEY